MQYYTPSIPAIERPPLLPDNTPELICPSCGDTMQHVWTIPQLGARLKQYIFVCPSCDEVGTKEVKRQLWRDVLKMRREQVRNPVKQNARCYARRMELPRTRAPSCM